MSKTFEESIIHGDNIKARSVILGNFIEELKLVKGTNNKKQFVIDFTKDQINKEVLCEFISAVYSKENFYQTKIDKTPYSAGIFDDTLKVDQSWYDVLRNFFEGTRRGDEGANRLNVLYNRCMTEQDKQLVEYVVSGEVKCGIGAATWNKLLETDVVYIPRYQRCSKLSDGNHNNWDGIIVQTKEDAQFVNIVINSDGVALYTRNWNEIVCNNLQILKTIIKNASNGTHGILMGEIYVTDPEGNRYGREKSNGTITGVIATGEDLPFGCGFDITLWDFVDLDSHTNKKCTTPYNDRLATTQLLVDKINVELGSVLTNFKVGLVKTVKVSTMEEVSKIFYKIVNSKGEGVVIKNPIGVWEHNDNGHKDIVKVKLPMNVKLRVVSFNEADPSSRHSNTFASINMRSECGKIITAMSGMKDSDRTRFNNDREGYIDAVFEVKCNGIQYNPEEPHSLYYANYLCERHDVDSAQDFEDILKVQQSAVEAISMI